MLPLVYIALTTGWMAGAARADDAQEEAEERDGGEEERDIDVSTVCPADVPRIDDIAVERSDHPYVLKADGSLGSVQGGASAFRVADGFFADNAGVVVQIRRGNTVLACGRVEQRCVYDLSYLPQVHAFEQLQLVVYQTLAPGSEFARRWAAIAESAPSDEDVSRANLRRAEAQAEYNFVGGTLGGVLESLPQIMQPDLLRDLRRAAREDDAEARQTLANQVASGASDWPRLLELATEIRDTPAGEFAGRKPAFLTRLHAFGPLDPQLAWAYVRLRNALESPLGRASRLAALAHLLEAIEPGDTRSNPERFQEIRFVAGRLKSVLEQGTSERRARAEVEEVLAREPYAEAELEGLRNALQTAREELAAVETRDGDCQLAVDGQTRECHPSEALVEQWRGRLSMAADRLRAFSPPSANPVDGLRSQRTRDAQSRQRTFCGRVATHDGLDRRRSWFVNQDALRPIVLHRVPVEFSDHVVVVNYGRGSERDHVRANDSVSLLVQRTPGEQPLSVRAVRGRVTSSLESLAPLLELFIKYSTGLRSEFVDGTCEEQEAAPIKYEGPLLQPLGARVLNLPSIASDETLDVTLCAHNECKADTSADHLRNQVRLRSGARYFGGFTVLLDASANVGLDRAFGGAKYRRFGEPSAGQQLYRLENNSSLRDRFTIGLFLALRFGSAARPERFLFATGPAVFPRSGGFNFQWDFRLGVQLFPGFYVTAGAGVRSVDRPDEPIGTLRSVADGQAAPTTNTSSTYHLVGSLGISIDLGALGDAATDLVSAAAGDGDEN